MQRLVGRYSIRSKPITQLDHQIEPYHWKSVEGYKFPIRGPFTQVVCDRGTAVLYVSQPGEVPLFYSQTPGWVHWHEQGLALPGRGIKRVNQGEAIIWTPGRCKTVKVDELPLPDIVPAVPIEQAVQQYLDCLIHAVKVRLGNHSGPIAVSQSGGIDSLMVSWALLQLGVEITPMTVCTSLNDYDISVTTEVLPAMGASAPIPIVVEYKDLVPLGQEAILCFEGPDPGNLKMAIGNILMARKCKELGLPLIFNGHAQDDLHGAGGLAQGGFKKSTAGTPAERWRDARRKEVHDATGMVKMFSTCFRRYGIAVRMPYYDADLVEWALSQPLSIFPVHHAKPFARAAACSVLPSGPWQESKYHSTGYITGAGFYEDKLRETVSHHLNQSRDWLNDYKRQGWQAIAQMHSL